MVTETGTITINNQQNINFEAVSFNSSDIAVSIPGEVILQ